MSREAAFQLFPVLETGRLVLRQIDLTDAEAIFSIKSLPNVTGKYGRKPHFSLSRTEEYIKEIQKDYSELNGLFWCIIVKESNLLAGTACLWNMDLESDMAELGYELHPDYWRKGIMTEALETVISWGFQKFELNRIEACPLSSNTASLGILLKLGFTIEGTLRERIKFNDVFEDQHYLSILRDEWSRRNSKS
jgi:ribosomal-protein-alanine N-acetyltransferase